MNKFKRILNSKNMIIIFYIFAIISSITLITQGNIMEAFVFSLFALVCTQAIEIKNLQNQYIDIFKILSIQSEINDNIISKVK